MNRVKPIAITMGDPAGIGPEIIVKAFAQAPEITSGCFVVGEKATLQRAAKLLGSDIRVESILEHQIGIEPAHSLPRVLYIYEQTTSGSSPHTLGEISAAAGKAAADAVVWAARAALNGRIAALVTAPLHKEALHAAGVHFPGHTELLQAEAAAFLGRSIHEVPVRMMLANEELHTVLVSIHMSLRDAIEAVSYDNVLQTIRITRDFLHATAANSQQTSGQGQQAKRMKIGVAGLNPHAGEGGLFGKEEIDTISPAIAAAKKEGIDVAGPFAPDTIFMRARSKVMNQQFHLGEFDAVIAMYHDQGLIPVKYLGVENGVNVTLGLPLIRTSPDHGTAFDIAGKGIADPSSLIAAIKMAKSLLPQP
ncbi:MAG TPA: 4-hydroxythreonine-4-phosphate dehydrogenase PdxA [Burkholderiaceae bacterium]|nr:4-hydroxythreonine-4-phosphate dehydrogenase PdxA [Burkholderiaceae bacterium]